MLPFQINWLHPLLKDFEKSDEKIDRVETEKKLIKVEERFAVTKPVSPIFCNQYEKGSLMDKTEARQIITAYVKKMVSYIFRC